MIFNSTHHLALVKSRGRGLQNKESLFWRLARKMAILTKVKILSGIDRQGEKGSRSRQATSWFWIWNWDEERRQSRFPAFLIHKVFSVFCGKIRIFFSLTGKLCFLHVYQISARNLCPFFLLGGRKKRSHFLTEVASRLFPSFFLSFSLSHWFDYAILSSPSFLFPPLNEFYCFNFALA